MALKIIEIVAPTSEMAAIARIADSHDVVDWWRTSSFEDERFSTELVVRPDGQQEVLDDLQRILDRCDNARIMIYGVQATLPVAGESAGEEGAEDARTSEAMRSREELYAEVSSGGTITSTYLLLCALSAVVAAMGMLEDSAAVVIGAMVIAPLLAPNLALALGTTLGDTELSRRAVSANFVGLGLSVGLALAIGLVIDPVTNSQLLDRTNVSYPAMILALASGAAAVLSLTSGAAAGLVGVMVAVALMPPAAALGLFVGWGQWDNAISAGLMLAINIAAINLSAKLVFVLKGITPRQWPDKSRARRSLRWSFTFWGVSLLVLAVLIWVAKY
ncbi:TIGR00341 family protein [Guyparkeria sp.]|uniref:TIGR00341 family protein n=1 Tax=Guyparkeria sp. TaxID=2035736 RepID=UPI003568DB62